MARIFFMLFVLCGAAGFGTGLHPVEATVGPSTFGVEAWILSTEIDAPMRYECGSTLARIDYLDSPDVADRGLLERLAGPRLMAGCDTAVRPWALATVLLLAASSLFMALTIVSIIVWMLMGTLRVLGRATRRDDRRYRRPVANWS